MKCGTCGRPTKVSETREAEGDYVARRMRKCSAGHSTPTYEITKAMYNAAKSDIRKVIKGQAYNQKIAKLAEQKQAMLAERRAGATAQELAEKYQMSIHMARYYTRLPKSELYPSAKWRTSSSSRGPSGQSPKGTSNT